MDPFLRKKQTCSPQQVTAFTESIVQMLICDMRPLSMVDGAGFQKMIEEFNPEYALPSRTYFTQKKYGTTFLKANTHARTHAHKNTFNSAG